MSRDKKNKSEPQNNSKIWMIFAILAILALFIVLGMRLFGSESEAIEIGRAPKNFELTTFSGETIDTKDLRGQVVLINFWSSWCTSCDEEALLLEAAYKFYQRNYPDQVAFLGVTYNDTEPASMYFMETHGMTFPNGPDLGGEISEIYQVGGVPETYILDEAGELTFLKFGSFISIDEITTAIDTAFSAD